MQSTITDVVATGDTVVVETSVTGTFENDLSGWYTFEIYLATHEVETWSVLNIVRLNADGKIVENRWYWDGFPPAESPQARPEGRNLGVVRAIFRKFNQHDAAGTRAYSMDPTYMPTGCLVSIASTT